MVFPRYSLRFLLLLGLFALFSSPSFANVFVLFPESTTQVGKGKKGEVPPRPRPKPGPQEGGDDD